MNSPVVFAFKDYKAYIKAQIASHETSWGLLTRLAKAAGCQRPYLSRVLAGEAHLTAAQVFGLANFWNLPEEEREYFLGLLELEKSGSAAYREYWKKKLSEAKSRHENISQLVNRKIATETEKDLLYYSAWYWTAIHILVSIPEFRSETKIAEKLNLPASQIREILMKLESWGAVQRDGRGWAFKAREQHIPKDSPLVSFHHNNWRQQAILSSQKARLEAVHYTVVQSVSRQDFEKIKQMILQLIQKTAEIAGPSKEEQLMCLTCDFFEP